jgi:peptide/nickel transport system ATP-binding protein/oligopeptide transport system ATP-binding protein
MTDDAAPVLVDVRSLSSQYRVRRGLFAGPPTFIRAVDEVSFQIRRGETLGLVGESGCGKTTLGRALLALRPNTGGTVMFEGRSVFELAPQQLKALRREMQIVFQDPFASLDPRKTVGRSVRAALDIHGIGDAAGRQAQVEEIFRRVGLRRAHTTRFPHEFSGGQRQRVGIARALVLRPKFLVCDEPVSALDVSIQAQILNLLKDLQAEFGLTLLFISHNLAVVEHMANRVAVMYYGKIVEIADREQLYARPRHPYTRALFDAVPLPDSRMRGMNITAEGDPPDPTNLPSGCRFRSRCRFAMDRCAQVEPALAEVAPMHQVACWLPQ